MTQHRLDGILSSDYLDGLGDHPTTELREMRAQCEAEERSVSYARRVLQGRLDILRAELLRRDGQGDREAGSLLSRLPDILGHDHVATDPLHARATRLDVPPESADHEAKIDAIADEATLLSLPDRSGSQVEELVGRLTALESELSTIRRELFDRIDRIRDELAARYKDGRASIGELLGTDR